MCTCVFFTWQINSAAAAVADWYKLLIKTLSLALKTMFTQRSCDAITVTWKTHQFHHFTSEHYIVSKSEVFEKVTHAANF